MVEAKGQIPGRSWGGLGAIEAVHLVELEPALLQVGAENLHQAIVVGIGRQVPQLGGEGIDHLGQQPIDRAIDALQPHRQPLLQLNAAAAGPAGGGRRVHLARPPILQPPIQGPTALAIAQHLPGGIEGHDRERIAAGIGMVPLHQGPVGALDFGGAGLARDAEHGVGILSQRERGQPSCPNNHPPIFGGRQTRRHQAKAKPAGSAYGQPHAKPILRSQTRRLTWQQQTYNYTAKITLQY